VPPPTPEAAVAGDGDPADVPMAGDPADVPMAGDPADVPMPDDVYPADPADPVPELLNA